MKNLNLVIRCDAGLKYGLGHLSRCITLAEVFPFISITLILRSDNQPLIHSFIESRNINKFSLELLFLSLNTSQKNELELIKLKLDKNNSLLILDHYEIDEGYQEFLLWSGIQWLQFDSHAKTSLYANWILHGSSAATHKMYQPLIKNSGSKLLVGSDYAIIKSEVRELRELAKEREGLKQIIICFGGGNDYGATLKVLNSLNSELLSGVKVKISVKGSDSYMNSIRGTAYQFSSFEIIHPNDLAKTMLSSDLAIISPGMISYEAACLGLPMLLITTADNQQINAQGWQDNDCAIFLGSLNDLNETSINSELTHLMSTVDSLTKLSKNCLKCIDGQGVFRVKNTVLGDYK